MSKARNLSKLGVDTSGLVDASTAIADSSITSAKIAIGAVTSDDIADNAIINGKIPANSIALSKIARTGTAGQVLVSGGPSADPSYATMANSYNGSNSQLFTGSGTFTVPTGVSNIKVTVVSGGGGTSGSYGGGGGLGGLSKGVYAVTPGTNYVVTVGGGGASAATGAGGSGGASSFGSLISVTGGAGRTSGSTKPVCGSGSNGNICNVKQSVAISDIALPEFGGHNKRYSPWGSNQYAGVAWSPTLQGKTPEYTASEFINLAPGACGVGVGDENGVWYAGGVGGAVLVEW